MCPHFEQHQRWHLTRHGRHANYGILETKPMFMFTACFWLEMDTFTLLFGVKMTFPHYLEGQCSLTRGPPQLTGDLIISPQNRRCEQEHCRLLRSVWGGQLGSTCYSVVSAGRICSPASRHPASRQAARPTNTCHSPAAATHGSIASSAVRTLAPATEPSLNQFHFIQFHITFDI